eukprot:TRINITY_DN25979_c0_g1_i1.p1 TRINITY_DN25979_c0_g1~~TRINITY_DN25979_c0_g1_i1.p1  ORF type:complete len:405 (+),score=76.28 TRINITY_DN25979_c0_g1_i1:48-1217(+)
MEKCIVCAGSGRLPLSTHCMTCPLCDGVPGWPGPEEQLTKPGRLGSMEVPAELKEVVEQMRRRLLVENPAKQLSVVSFNMLLKGFDAKPYYPSVTAELRAWPRRRELLLELLSSVDADVYCMQEVECLTFDQESAFLSEIGYAWVAPKDDAKGKWPDMAKPAFFYKADRLELLWTDHRSRVVLASFRHRRSGQIVYMATCHLEGAPWEAEKRIAQTKKALDSLKRQVRKDQQERCTDSEKAALIFAGDFNEEANGAVCHLLHTGSIESCFRVPGLPETELTKADYSHNFALSDIYGSMSDRPPTFCAPPEASAAWGSQVHFASVDFVFYSRESLRPVAVREPFTPEQTNMTRSVGIPSAWHFSDHVPIGGVLDFITNDRTLKEAAPAVV